MEVLRVLEQKIAVLVDLVEKTRADNARLIEEKVELETKIKVLESLQKSDEEREVRFVQERELTKSVVDGLIDRINSLSGSEPQ